MTSSFGDSDVHIRNLEVGLDPLERGRDKLSIKYSCTSNGVRMRILCTFEVSAVSGGRIGYNRYSTSWYKEGPHVILVPSQATVKVGHVLEFNSASGDSTDFKRAYNSYMDSV